MLRLDKVVKPWKESAALNDHINLHGFWNETVFLTKGGDVASVVTSKPANGGQGKTGQRKRPRTRLFYAADSCGGKSVFVRQLLGPHLST